MTDVALREYLERLITAAEARAEARSDALLAMIQQRHEGHAGEHGIHLTAHREAHEGHLLTHRVDMAVASDKVGVVDRRLDAIAKLADEREHNADVRLKSLENKNANLDGRMAMFAALPILLSVAGLIVAVTK